jgi:hypothetical protein
MFLNEGEIPREKKNNPNNLPQFHVEKTNQQSSDLQKYTNVKINKSEA